MTTFLRYILTHYQTISPTINWFLPAAYSPGSHSLLGMPWEIFRTTEILNQTNRPVTFVTKGGGLTGSYSYSVLLPDYDLAITMLVSGELDALNAVLDAVTIPLVRGAEDAAQKSLRQTYAGTYQAQHLNSSIAISQSAAKSLHVTHWISNGTDVLPPLTEFVAGQAGQGNTVYYQLVPTQISRRRGGRVGEVWRFYNVLDTTAGSEASELWSDYCVANFDPIQYAGKPLNEVVFWKDGRDGEVMEVELTAFKAVLERE
jgi:hypothetical protein